MSNRKPFRGSSSEFLRVYPAQATGSSSSRTPSPSGSASTAEHRPQSSCSDTSGHGPSSSTSSLLSQKPPSAPPSHPEASSINDPQRTPISIELHDDISGERNKSLENKDLSHDTQANQDLRDGSDDANNNKMNLNEESPEIINHSEAPNHALSLNEAASLDTNANNMASPASDTNKDPTRVPDASQDTSPNSPPPSDSKARETLDITTEKEQSLTTHHDENIFQNLTSAGGLMISINDEVKSPTAKPEVDPDEIDPHPNNRFKGKASPAQEEWNRLKAQGFENSEIDELMEMVGLEEVKRQFIAMKIKVETCERQGTDLKKERFNIIFQGNPGTGKTTVARIYARFLHTCGIIESHYVKETSGARLAYQGPQIAKKKIKKMMKNRRHKGGVLFVDEAYQLTADHTSNGGRQVLDILLTMMENYIGKLVVIFVGYNNEMQSFFEHNPGLLSRIPYTLQFDDFDDMELWTILRDGINKKYNSKMKITGGMEGLFMRIAIRRLGYGRGFKGFGNARSVHNLLSKISERQARRLAKEASCDSSALESLDYFRFTKEDLIGPEPTEVLKKSSARIKLESLVGLQQVKESTRNMIEIISTNYLRELKEMSPLNFSLNRVFLGSPGTGKTTVAKLYGQIMAELGLLSNGEVVIKNPSDFIGQCLGKSEAKTRAILASTAGKVLIIDEAYMLNHGGAESDSKGDSYKMAVIDTLVAEVQSVPGDDRCILILGYEDKIKDMFHNVNPGLSRRFAIEDPFLFQDFDLLQLKEILKMKMEQQHLSATNEAMKVALEVLDRARIRPNFCNAGEVDNCLAKAKLNYQARQMKETDRHKRAYDAKFLPEDFDPDYQRSSNAVENCRKNLQGMVDDHIISKLEGYQSLASAARIFNVDPRTQIPTNFVFKGPPGTGKTTTARNMGKVFYDMGFLSTDEVVECSASDLIGQYMGHTGPKTRGHLDKALGKVLFIDEAYHLIEGQYATEAVNVLINRLTNPRYAQKMVVILAGYSQDMNWLMTARPALSGLFPEEIIFENIKPDACLALLSRELKDRNILVPFLQHPHGVDYKNILSLMRMLSLFPSWSNARDIKTLAKEMAGYAFKEPLTGCLTQPVLSPDQAKSCMKKMISMLYQRSLRVEEGSDIRRPICFPPESKQATCNAPLCESAPAAHGVDQETVSAEISEELNQTTPELQFAHPHEQADNTSEPLSNAICLRPLNPEGIPREEDVPDHVWNQLQEDIKAEKDAKVNQTSEERQKKEKLQKILQQSGSCINGFEWTPQSGGYRCAGGAHFVSHGDLERQMN